MMARTVELAAEEIGVVNPVCWSSASRLPKPGRGQREPAGAGGAAWFQACSTSLVVLSPHASTTPLSGIALPSSLATAGSDWDPTRNQSPAVIARPGRALFRWNDGYQESVQLARSGTNEFTLKLAAISQGFRYSVQAGEARADLHREAGFATAIARMQVRIEPPAYTHWTNRIVEAAARSSWPAAASAGRRTADEKVADAEWVAEGLRDSGTQELRDSGSPAHRRRQPPGARLPAYQ